MTLNNLSEIAAKACFSLMGFAAVLGNSDTMP
jgi:hypothetical protein